MRHSGVSIGTRGRNKEKGSKLPILDGAPSICPLLFFGKDKLELCQGSWCMTIILVSTEMASGRKLESKWTRKSTTK